MEERKFKKIVERAVKNLPLKIKEKMENVAICIERSPSKSTKKKLGGLREKSVLLGLYEGVPQNVWGRGFGCNLPDKITIFQDSMEAIYKTEEEVERAVQKTVYHEVTHHFGFNEKETRRLEKIFYEKHRSNK